MTRVARSVLFVWFFTLALLLQPCAAHAEKSKENKSEASQRSGKVDINSASREELESLPGVGSATARKIIELRPFRSLQDLERAGLSDSEIKKLKGKAKASRSGEAKESSRSRERTDEDKSSRAKKDDDGKSSERGRSRDSSENESSARDRSSAEKIDINSASAEELESLPDVGPATAQKIIEGRPYRTKADLKNSGISQGTVEKIYPLVVARGGSGANDRDRQSRSEPREPESTTARDRSQQNSDLPQSDVEPEDPVSDAPAKVPPEPGMVWVNTDSGLFHREGDHWFGRTKEGKFMFENEAVRAGYRKAWSGNGDQQ